MKNVYFLSAILILSCRHKTNPALARHLQTLLDAHEFFQFYTQFKTSGQDLTLKDQLYFSAYEENIFNKNEACIATIDSIDLAAWPDSVKANLLMLQSDSYSKIGQYAKAAHNDSIVISNYPKALDSNTLNDLKNQSLIQIALKNTSPQQVSINGSNTIHWTSDALGIPEIPLTTDHQTISAIFDTRANISSITKTYAEKLHLHLLDVNYRENSGITGAQFQVGLGVADSLYIGTILIRNCVFQVMPDSILNIAGQFQINIVLGFTAIRQLQEVQWYSNGTLNIPQTPDTSSLRNLALDGLDPVLALVIGNDTLGFHFDTGASSTILYARYFEKFKNSILKAALKEQKGFGGAGGVSTKDIYTLPHLQLTCNGKSVSIDSVSVFTQKISPGEKMYGNLGEDFMHGFSELTLNFRDMSVTGK